MAPPPANYEAITQEVAASKLMGATVYGSDEQSLGEISDSVVGLARIQLDKYDETDKRIAAQISEQSARISAMQISLSARLQAADALLASLESQQSVLDASIQSLNLTLYGRNES